MLPSHREGCCRHGTPLPSYSHCVPSVPVACSVRDCARTHPSPYCDRGDTVLTPFYRQRNKGWEKLPSLLRATQWMCESERASEGKHKAATLELPSNQEEGVKLFTKKQGSEHLTLPLSCPTVSDKETCFRKEGLGCLLSLIWNEHGKQECFRRVPDG